MSGLTDRYINPLTDFGFKKLFGTEPNKSLLIDFLNQILPDKHKIKDLSYSSNENVGHSELDRMAIFDLYCTGNSGERFIVEIQKAKQDFFKDRSVYYASFPFQEQAKKGNWNFKLDPVYAIGILDFIFDDHKDDEDLIHFVELKNQRSEVFYDKLKFIYIELPKFIKTEEELDAHFDKWLYIFRHLSELQSRPSVLQEKIFKRLFESAEIAKFTRDERVAYEDSLKYYRDLNNVIDTSRSEGEQEGFIKGTREGRLQGIKEGKIKGKVEIALTLKSKGMTSQEISQITGLPIDDIDKL